jgi:imidazolonepropionase
LAADLSVLGQIARMRNHPIGLMSTWCPGGGPEKMPGAAPLAATLELISRRKLAGFIELKSNSDPAIRDPVLAAANKAEMKLSLDWVGGSRDDLWESLARFSPACVFCHHSFSKDECDVLAQAKSVVVFSVGGALLDSQPGTSVRDLLEAGGAIALGSGYDALYEPNFNMQLVLALAVRRLNLTIEQAIVATTINAAHAMNCGDQIGSLEPGKRADVLVLNLNDYREIPRRLGVNHVAMAIREGNLAINRTRWRVGAA